MPETFHPELMPRKGERTAWILSLLVTIGLFFYHASWGEIPFSAWFFWGFLLFSALSISLGNWMDRQTSLTLSPEGVSFTNGVRRVHFSWEEIETVRVFPARWGRKVQVIGQKAHFEFRTLGEISYRGEVRGQMGFSDGEKILENVLRFSGLTLEREENGSYFYTRS